MESPYAPASTRTLAHVLDCVAMGVLTFLGGLIGGMQALQRPGIDMDALSADPVAFQAVVQPGVYAGLAVAFAAVTLLNFGLIEGWLGGSVGKLALGLRVVRVSGAPIGVPTAIGRTFCYFIAGIPFYAGYAAIFFDRQMQCWHDKIAGTVVIRRGAQVPAVAGLSAVPVTAESSTPARERGDDRAA